MELFDYKPRLEDLQGAELPASIRMGQRLTAMTAAQQSFPVVPSVFKFAQHGESRAWVSELMPYTAKVADELCFIKSMHTEAINHDPGITFLPDRLSARGPAQHWGLAFLWFRQREQRLAGLCRHGVERLGESQRPAAVRPAMGQRVSPYQVSGGQVPLGRRPGPLFVKPSRHRRERSTPLSR